MNVECVRQEDDDFRALHGYCVYNYDLTVTQWSDYNYTGDIQYKVWNQIIYLYRKLQRVRYKIHPSSNVHIAFYLEGRHTVELYTYIVCSIYRILSFSSNKSIITPALKGSSVGEEFILLLPLHLEFTLTLLERIDAVSAPPRKNRDELLHTAWNWVSATHNRFNALAILARAYI